MFFNFVLRRNSFLGEIVGEKWGRSEGQRDIADIIIRTGLTIMQHTGGTLNHRIKIDAVVFPKGESSDDVFIVVTSPLTRRQDVDNYRWIGMINAGELARSHWSVQDELKFELKGDRRLIKLAMKNCLE